MTAIPDSEPPRPRLFHGVDFSGAANAGRSIWIAAGRATGAGLTIEDCRPAERLPGGGRRRHQALAALRQWIAGQGAAAIGMDFPFGLPLPLVRNHPDWETFLLDFPARYRDAETFRDACRAAAPGRELRRVTDRAARTPFSPYNLRMFRQTYHGIAEVLEPLVRDGVACVPPMQPLQRAKPWLLEICPASALKALGLYRPYKGRGRSLRVARRALLEALSDRLGLSFSAEIRRTALENVGGDALDSIVAAWCAWQVAGDWPTAAAPPLPPEAMLEAWVFLPDGAVWLEHAWA